MQHQSNMKIIFRIATAIFKDKIVTFKKLFDHVAVQAVFLLKHFTTLTVFVRQTWINLHMFVNSVKFYQKQPIFS